MQRGAIQLMSREIPLTQNKVALVDDEDYEDAVKHKWCAMHIRGRWYAARTCNGTTQYLHTFILGKFPGWVVDHIDGNGLNCTDRNMRYCRPAQNQRNRAIHKNNVTGFKGVSFMATGKRKKRWRALIGAEGQHIHIGIFATPEEAARAYDLAAIKYHGEFARLNFAHRGGST